jgi:hypothetical protein
MIEIFRIPLVAEKLDSIPEAERNLIFALGHFANEINILSKLFYWTSHNQPKGDIHQHGSNAQAMMIARLLCGKLHEGWRLMQNAYFGTKISRDYNELYDDDGKDAFRRLGRYFGGENLVSEIRNNFAFHYSPEEIGRCYVENERDDELVMLLSTDNANTLYHYAEVIVDQSLLTQIRAANPEEAMKKIIDESSEIIRLFNIAIGSCLTAAFKLHLGQDLDDLVSDTIQLRELPGFKNIGVPYFVDTEDGESVA